MGDGIGAALILPDGVIDWWCPNRFEADPVLWALLDRRGGRSRWVDAEPATWDACPAGPTARSVVRIRGERIELWDGLLALDGGGSMLVRMVRTSTRPLELTHELRAGGFDGPGLAWRPTPAGLAGDRFVVCADRVTLGDDGTVVVAVTAAAGRWSGFAVLADGSHPTDEDALAAALGAAEAGEREAMQRLRLPRRHASRATDALHVLRALTDRSTGAPVAAATTSLPEAPGGQRQFDYRYTWLRDSGLAVATASALGHLHAASRYLGFVGRLLDRDDGLRPMSTTSGPPAPAEREIDDVEGWAGSRPVRVGNAAHDQVQLDAVAIVIDAVWSYVSSGGSMDRATWRIVDDLAGRLARSPFGPTSGVWELRQPRPLVSEEIARWHGLDVALRLRRWFRPWARRPEWHRARHQARRRVVDAIDVRTGRLPQTFGAASGPPTEPLPDAAALTAAITGLLPRRDRRAARLVTATIEALEQGPFLRRYPPADDGFSGIEAAFVPASWWAVSALAAVGLLDEARRRADELCATLPPVQAEEWDVVQQVPLGNLPLLWSHMEAARALYVLEREDLRRRVGRVGVGVWRVGRYLRVRLSGREPFPSVRAAASSDGQAGVPGSASAASSRQSGDLDQR